jgi:two-component system, NtrC family, response regulator AtoC
MSNILIIEDDELQIAVLRSFLLDEGYNVYATADGPQGILIFQKQNIDLVLLDIGIPSMSGLDVLQEIKKIDDQAKVIVVTGYASVESSVYAIKYGAIDYLQKPVDFNTLSEKIKKALKLTIE